MTATRPRLVATDLDGTIVPHDGEVSDRTMAALQAVEALVTGGLASNSVEFVRTTRGWTDEEWAAGVARCRARGLVDDDGLTRYGERVKYLWNTPPRGSKVVLARAANAHPRDDQADVDRQHPG